MLESDGEYIPEVDENEIPTEEQERDNVSALETRIAELETRIAELESLCAGMAASYASIDHAHEQPRVERAPTPTHIWSRRIGIG